MQFCSPQQHLNMQLCCALAVDVQESMTAWVLSLGRWAAHNGKHAAQFRAHLVTLLFNSTVVSVRL
jgi:hypothetical protein